MYRSTEWSLRNVEMWFFLPPLSLSLSQTKYLYIFLLFFCLNDRCHLSSMEAINTHTNSHPQRGVAASSYNFETRFSRSDSLIELFACADTQKDVFSTKFLFYISDSDANEISVGEWNLSVTPLDMSSLGRILTSIKLIISILKKNMMP